MEKFLQKVPHANFTPAYGLTEASPVTHTVFKCGKYRDSAGFPMPDTEAKIVHVDDPKMLGLGPNEMGEVLVRGPQVMIGYHNNEKATKETITSDGWLRTDSAAQPFGRADQDRLRHWRMLPNCRANRAGFAGRQAAYR